MGIDLAENKYTEDQRVLLAKIITEATHDDRYTFSALSRVAQEEIIDVLLELRDSGKSTRLNALWELDFLERPVSPEVFLNDERYFGPALKDENGQLTIYDQWYEDLLYVLDPHNDVREWIIGGAIGIGKSTNAEITQAYKLYFMSCLRNPHTYYGLTPGSMIVFALFNLTRDKSDLALYYHFNEMLVASPYFRERFPAKRAQRGKPKELSIELPRSLHVLTGSQITHALSLNIYSGILDEMNFRRGAQEGYSEHSQSYNLYNEAKARINSRFGPGKPPPGLLCNISSARTTTDYLDEHIRRCAGDPRVKISKYAFWEVHRPGSVRYMQMYPSGKSFSVLLGDRQHDPKLLEPGDEVNNYPGRLSKQVPMEHWDDFYRDLTYAIQNILGHSTAGSRPLFTSRGPILDCINTTRLHPFTKTSISLGIYDDPAEKYADYFLKDYACLFTGYMYQPRVNPNAMRAIHVDLARVKCPASISMGHVQRYRPRSLADPGDSDIISLPVVFMDFMLQIPPPKQGEIDFHRIVEFIVWLRDMMHYNITIVTYDGWQSDHSLQLLLKRDFNAKHLSIDKTDAPYLGLKSLVMEGNLDIYDYQPLMEELPDLQHDVVSKKVDHLPNREKDVSDTLAGVVHDLMTSKLREVSDADDMAMGRLRDKADPIAAYAGPDAWAIGRYKVRSGYFSAEDTE